MKKFSIIILSFFLSIAAFCQQTVDFEKVTGGATMQISGRPPLSFNSPVVTYSNDASSFALRINDQVYVFKTSDHITINNVLMTSQTAAQIVTLLQSGVFNASSSGGVSEPNDSSTLYASSFMVTGDSTTDNLTAMRNLVAYIEAGHTGPGKRAKVILPTGVIKVSGTIIINLDVLIYWEGKGSAQQGRGNTAIYSTSSTADLFNDSSQGSSYTHIAFWNSTTSTAGAAVNNIYALNKFEDCFFEGFFYQIQFKNENYSIIRACQFYNAVQYAIFNANGINPDAGDMIISDCSFGDVSRSTVAMIFQNSSGGMKMSNLKFNAGGNFIGDCIRVFFSGSGIQTGDLNITNSSFENFTGYGVNIQITNSATLVNVEISNSQISSLHGGSGINLVANTSGTLGHVVLGNLVIGNSTSVGITATGVSGLVLSGIDNYATTQYSFSGNSGYFNDRDAVGSWTVSGSDIYYPTGTVGIGRLSTGSVLDIYRASATANLNIESGLNTGLAYMSTTNNSGNGSYQGVSGSTAATFHSVVANSVFLRGSASSVAVVIQHDGAHPIIFNTNNAEVGRWESTGNLNIGTVTDLPSSLVTMASTTKGFLPPRMTTTQKNAISSPAEGLIVYDVTLHALYGWNGSAWTAAW